MKRFFRPNIDSRGRWVRAIAGSVLAIAGLVAGGHVWWLGAVLILSGGFVLFEAVRGWCVMRACGIKTKM